MPKHDKTNRSGKRQLILRFLPIIALIWAAVMLVYTFKFDKGSSGIAFMLLVVAYYIYRAGRYRSE